MDVCFTSHISVNFQVFHLQKILALICLIILIHFSISNLITLSITCAVASYIILFILILELYVTLRRKTYSSWILSKFFNSYIRIYFIWWVDNTWYRKFDSYLSKISEIWPITQAFLPFLLLRAGAFILFFMSNDGWLFAPWYLCLCSCEGSRRKAVT